MLTNLCFCSLCSSALELSQCFCKSSALELSQCFCKSCFNNCDELTAIGHHGCHYRMTSERLKWRRQHRQHILH
ncbi:hypothetical protein BDA96_06G178900 [Sorghum bicolor]|uniref:FLZ-type domain-containing protein n=2 Tax=Sorghum bicolor TaxID=4558 RepID=A0A921QS24_SORBI|nr:hypothetical protein BDA96_08G084500 [Sorghum bicolor]KAG0526816.1 hypothetical protein BDA96_06G178900 [Sorghum bicolor]OQU82034.1 hypothetical protein SORBI_3006G162550 [Sorghum bicolor]